MQAFRVDWMRARRIVLGNPDAVFTAIAIALTITAVATIPPGGAEAGYNEPDGLSTALVVVQTAVIAFLRRWPIAVITILVGALISEAALGYELGDAAFLASLVVVFGVGSLTSGARAAYGAATTVVVLVTLFMLEGGGITSLGDLLINVAIFLVAFAGGMVVRSRVARVAQVESFAAELSLERDRAAAAAVADERARIARELHDAVGHTLNLIVVQAGAAKRVRESNPAVAFEALNSIENTGRQALADMDRMLGILRDHPDSAGEAGLGPRPGLTRLEPMLDEARAAGLSVDLTITGEARKLPVSIDLTAYRIVQESMTNAIKHAPGAKATVRIDYAAGSLGLDIQNGPPRSRPAGAVSGRRGLPGMQERVALFGGSLKHGPTPDGGFRVQVSLPIDGSA